MSKYTVRAVVQINDVALELNSRDAVEQLRMLEADLKTWDLEPASREVRRIRHDYEIGREDLPMAVSRLRAASTTLMVPSA
jgi:hypothetical protein